MKKKIALFFLFAFVIGVLSCNGNEEIKLIENRSSSYVIIIPHNFTNIEQDAAYEVQKYIYDISKVRLPVLSDKQQRNNKEIRIGRTNRPTSLDYFQLDPDGIFIEIKDESIFISGGERKGILYAAYSFLETFLGVRKTTSASINLKKTSTIVIPSNFKTLYNPPFKYRSLFYKDVYRDKKLSDWYRLNYFFEGYGFFDDKGSVVHTFDKIISPKKYFKKHPEYFSLINGVRTPKQLCLSNPELLAKVINNIGLEMSKKPELKFWSVSPNDNTFYCQCNLCENKHKNGNGYMETLLPFVNKIASKFPSKTISTLAYNQSLIPPKHLIPNKNVEIMVCATNVNRAIPIPDDKSEEGKNFRLVLEGWLRKTKNILIWDYVANFVNVLGPYPNIYIIKPNIQYFKSVGVKKLFIEGIGNYLGEFSELKTFLISKLLWNSEIDIKILIEEFLGEYYGEAGRDIKWYINELHKDISTAKDKLSPLDYTAYKYHTFLNFDNLKKYKSIFAAAESKVKNNEEKSKRVLKERLSVDFAELAIACYSKAALEKVGGYKELSKKIITFVDNCKKCNIVYISNGGVTVRDFYEEVISKCNK